jgi:hypothetical protein
VTTYNALYWVAIHLSLSLSLSLDLSTKIILQDSLLQESGRDTCTCRGIEGGGEGGRGREGGGEKERNHRTFCIIASVSGIFLGYWHLAAMYMYTCMHMYMYMLYTRV